MSEKIMGNRGDSCCAIDIDAKRSQAGTLGALSAGLASVCCGLPLLLLAVGLGGLGLGSFLGTYHWYFTGAGILLLGGGWFFFYQEKARLRAAGSEIRHARMTPAILAVATAAVVGFGGLNIASALGLGPKAAEVRQASTGSDGELAQVVLRVTGMSCITCEWGIEKALGKLEGVVEAKASSAEEKVLVRYQPGKVTFEQMIETVDSTGYKASMPDMS